MFTIVVFVLVLGVIVLFHEFGHFIAAKKSGMRVEEFGIGFPPRLFYFQKGETKYSINLLPLGGFVKIKGEDGESLDSDSFANKPIWKRFITLVAGIFMNLVLAWLLLSIVFMIGAPQAVDGNDNYDNERIIISLVEPNSPADEKGLEAGDVVLEINGQSITNTSQIQEITKNNTGEKVSYKVLRGDRQIEIELIPRTDPPAGQGAIGVGLVEVADVSYSWYQSIWKGLLGTWEYLKLTLVGFGVIIKQLIIGQPIQGDVAGPVGIAVMTGRFAKMGISMLLQFTALLSVNIAIINALPIPALDGGRILFLAIEAIRGKKIKPKIEQMANGIGFALLILLILFITVRDIINNFS